MYVCACIVHVFVYYVYDYAPHVTMYVYSTYSNKTGEDIILKQINTKSTSLGRREWDGMSVRGQQDDINGFHSALLRRRTRTHAQLLYLHYNNTATHIIGGFISYDGDMSAHLTRLYMERKKISARTTMFLLLVYASRALCVLKRTN